jgi:hypothetical protein
MKHLVVPIEPCHPIVRPPATARRMVAIPKRPPTSIISTLSTRSSNVLSRMRRMRAALIHPSIPLTLSTRLPPQPIRRPRGTATIEGRRRLVEGSRVRSGRTGAFCVVGKRQHTVFVVRPCPSGLLAPPPLLAP